MVHPGRTFRPALYSTVAGFFDARVVNKVVSQTVFIDAGAGLALAPAVLLVAMLETAAGMAVLSELALVIPLVPAVAQADTTLRGPRADKARQALCTSSGKISLCRGKTRLINPRK